MRISVVARTDGKLREAADSCKRAADLEDDAYRHDLSVEFLTEEDGYVPFEIIGSEEEITAFARRNAHYGPFDIEED